jgi:hypothetical protein
MDVTTILNVTPSSIELASDMRWHAACGLGWLACRRTHGTSRTCWWSCSLGNRMSLYMLFALVTSSVPWLPGV